MAIDIEAEFEKHNDNYARFEDMPNKRSNCAEIHAFLLLNELIPTERMICSAKHDQIWLDVEIEKLAEIITPEQVAELSICGVFYDDDTELLSMFS